jgi:hypothetical protein
MSGLAAEYRWYADLAQAAVNLLLIWQIWALGWRVEQLVRQPRNSRDRPGNDHAENRTSGTDVSNAE